MYAERMIGFGVDVILDFGFWKKKARQEAIAKAKTLGATPILYNFVCSQAEANRRVLKRNKTLAPDSLVIDDHALKLFEGMFEPVGDDEECVVVKTEKIKN